MGARLEAVSLLLLALVCMTSTGPFAQGLEAVLSVSPDTVNAVSTLRMQIMFDETIGKGGMVSVMLPESISLDQQLSIANRALSFNPQDNISCKSDSSAVKIIECLTPNSRQLDLQLSSDSFVMAGQSLVFTAENACQNPSSLWFKDESLMIST